MRAHLKRTGVSFLILFLSFPFVLGAAQIKGKIQSISNRAKTVQMMVIKTKKVQVVRFSKATKFINAKSMKDFIKKDVIIVDVEGEKPATSIKRVLVQLPKNKVISTKRLSKLVLNDPSGLTVVDARPSGPYNIGHIPGSLTIPVTVFAKKTKMLPHNKKSLLVFYCGGPT